MLWVLSPNRCSPPGGIPLRPASSVCLLHPQDRTLAKKSVNLVCYTDECLWAHECSPMMVINMVMLMMRRNMLAMSTIFSIFAAFMPIVRSPPRRRCEPHGSGLPVLACDPVQEALLVDTCLPRHCNWPGSVSSADVLGLVLGLLLLSAANTCLSYGKTLSSEKDLPSVSESSFQSIQLPLANG